MPAEPTSSEYPTLCVIAFAGEREALHRTLTALNPVGAGSLAPVGAAWAANEPGALVLGSNDPELADLAHRMGVPFSACLPERPEADSYWSTILAALPKEKGWLAVLRAGVDMPAWWLERLRAVAGRTGADAVFPLNVRHPCTSAFSSPGHQPGLSVADVDRWLNRYAPGRNFDLPGPVGYCALLGARARDFSRCVDDSQLAMAWREAGILPLATDQVYVDDSILTAQTLPADCYEGWRLAWLDRHPLTAARHALTELSARHEEPGPDVPEVKPVRLHLAHSWGGGLGRWVEDFIAADDRHDNLVLRPIGDRSAFGQTLALYPSAAMDVPLRTWTLAQPILSTALRHFEYRQLLAEIVADFAVESLMVSSLVGHSLEVFDAGVPVTYVCHDFYPVCPPIVATFHTPCVSCDAERLRECLRDNPAHTFFRYESDGHWLALRQALGAALCEDSVTVIAPSVSTRERWRSLLPALAKKDIEVIAHGLPQDLIDSLRVARERAAVTTAGQPLRLVVLGSLASHKGGDVLHEALSCVSGVELLLLGSGSDGRRFRGRNGVTVVERYEREALGGLLAEFAPDAALLLSTVPETFSYTLSELWTAGIPVAATRLGAFADRIEPGVNGWLFEPTAKCLSELLERLTADREQIDSVRGRVRQAPVRDSAAMVADYRQVGSVLPGVVWRPRVQLPQASGYTTFDAFYIDHQASYRTVLGGFIQFTLFKLEASPRVPVFVKKCVIRLAHLVGFRRS